MLDHRHFTGKFLGWAYSQCIIKRRNLNFTPLFVHDLTNYDLHHVVLALHSLNEKNTISVVPSTSEKFILLQIGEHKKATQNKKGNWTNQIEYIRLLDSFNFMNASLDKLVQNLAPDQFSLLEQHFQEGPTSAVNLLKQNGSFLYCYLDRFEKLQERQLPPRDKRTNRIQQYEVAVSEDEYNQALHFHVKILVNTATCTWNHSCSYSLQLFFAFGKFAMIPTDWTAVSITFHQICRATQR